MNEIGHNKPPEAIELASDVIGFISAYMADYPVIQKEEDARLMKVQIDRAKLCIKDLEAERDGKVRPLNNRVDDINGTYRKSRRMLGNLLDEMLGRLQDFVIKEEQRREEMARVAALKAKTLELAAKEAERLEQERLDDIAKGEVGVDVAEVISNADDAFEEYQRAEREAILAKKDTHVKVGGGFSRAIGLREKETLTVTDYTLALRDMGLTSDIEDAILKAARAWRKVHETLPRGIKSTMEKQL